LVTFYDVLSSACGKGLYIFKYSNRVDLPILILNR
jgi:hypothetical protein